MNIFAFKTFYFVIVFLFFKSPSTFVPKVAFQKQIEIVKIKLPIAESKTKGEYKNRFQCNHKTKMALVAPMDVLHKERWPEG